MAIALVVPRERSEGWGFLSDNRNGILLAISITAQWHDMRPRPGDTGRLVMFGRYVADPRAARLRDIACRLMKSWGKIVSIRHSGRKSMSISKSPLATMTGLSSVPPESCKRHQHPHNYFRRWSLADGGAIVEIPHNPPCPLSRPGYSSDY